MNEYKKFVVLQHDQKDCGCACLKTILKYNGGNANLEHLKELSGTTSKGTSMLGLIQATEKFGLNAEAYEASVDDLKELQKPTILHIETEAGYYHYVVCFTFSKGKFIISDPALGILKYEEQDLLKVWKKGYLLTLEKNSRFQHSNIKKNTHLKWLMSIIEVFHSFNLTFSSVKLS